MVGVLNYLSPLLAAAALSASAQSTPPSTDSNLLPPAQDTVPAQVRVVENGGDFRVWESVTTNTDALGVVTSKTNKFTELNTGMHYWNGQDWVQSDPTFSQTADGFVADKIQHAVRLTADLNVASAVSISTPDGQQVHSTPVAIGLYSPSNGQFAVIGEITNCTGTLVSNSVVYPNPFVDAQGSPLCGSMVYSLSQSTFEQDYVWQSSLDVTAYGFDTNCWVQIISEIQSGPEADILERPIYVEHDQAVRSTMVTPDIIDQLIGFGSLAFSTGTAYTSAGVGQTNLQASVFKELRVDGSRRLLIESVPYKDLQDGFKALPPCGPTGGAHAQFKRANLKSSYASIHSPPKLLSRAPTNAAAQIARVTTKPIGVYIDYVATLGGTIYGTTNFSSYTNWYVSGYVTCNGAVTIEGGAIFKYATNTSISLNNTLTLKVGMYRPAVFTAVDDNTVGDTLNTTICPSYTGAINTGGYANPAFSFASSATVNNCRFLYAKIALQCGNVYGSFALTASHSQFWKCVRGISLGGNGTGELVSLAVNNCLMGYVTYPLTFPQWIPFSCTMSSCTFDHATQLLVGYFGGATVTSKNCVYANITTWGSTPGGDHNGFQTNTTPAVFGSSTFGTNNSPFQTVGCGSYYLASSSLFRDVGTTTGLPSGLAAGLQARTTQPPTVLAQGSIATNMTLSQQSIRDTNTLDLGYHIDPLDWAISGVYFTNGTTLTINPGTAIAAFQISGTSSGLLVGSQIQSVGTPKQPIWIVQYNTVQEGSTSNWQRNYFASVAGLLNNSGGPPSPVYCRFTDFSSLGIDCNHFYAPTNTASVAFQDCEFHGGQIGTGVSTLNFTNCLLERVYTSIAATSGGTMYFRNCLVYGGYLSLSPASSVIADNLFDQVAIPNGIGGSGHTYTGYNAYITNCDRLQPTNYNDIILATNAVAYQSGTLGNYYQQSTSPLINAGSTNAALVWAPPALYHYTTMTSQVKETNSLVDLSYHYVATDVNGVPLDADSNNTPDYLETNFDGDSLPDAWELGYFGDLTRNGTGDYDGDGTSDLAEYLASTNPANNMVVAWGANSSGQCNVPVGLTDVKAVGAGSAHTIVLKMDGTVTGWGDNSNNQLQFPSTISNNVIAIAAGYNCCLALTTDGHVIAWGKFGEFASDLSDAFVPSGLGTVTAIAAGSFGGLALKADGTVVGWGAGQNGSLLAAVPSGLANVTAIAASRNHALALKTDGTVASWGATLFDMWPVPSGLTATAIAAGPFHSLALRTDGTVAAWGLSTDTSTSFH